MERDISGGNFQSLLEAIKSSEVVEDRIQLITKLGESEPLEESDLGLLLDCLTMLWEDFTCLDASQCMLNRALLHISVKYLEAGASRFLLQFLTLGTKASSWCDKHLKMTLMSTGDSQGEHSSCFFKLLLELLKFSVACFPLLEGKHVLVDEVLHDAVEKYILEQFTVIRDLISEIKGIHTFGSEILKVVELVINATTKLCNVYWQSINFDSCEAKADKEDNLDRKDNGELNYVINIIKYTVEKLCELGTLAAKGGGSLATILNSSWKGVVSLLQIDRGELAEKVNVADIIVTLISLAVTSLRCVAETWSSSLNEILSVTQAKRAFLPIKFYLINAVRISSQYPQHAFSVYQEITLCILLVFTYRVMLCKDSIFKNVVEALEELLKPTVLNLLNSLLSSAQLEEVLKLQVLNRLFWVEDDSNDNQSEQTSAFLTTSVEDLFSITCESMLSTKRLLVGRFALFIDLLKFSSGFREDVMLEISSKLQWFLNILVNEEIYTAVLVLQIPSSYGDGNTVTFAWQPMLYSVVHALKIFLISVPSSRVWIMFEFFLLENLFHPHFLCSEIVVELWCFMVRHAEDKVVNAAMGKLCSLYKLVASSGLVLSPGCALRKMARLMSVLLSSCAQTVVDQVYKFIVNDQRSQVSLVMHVALLLEGFQLNLLSDALRSITIERIINDYIHFVENFTEDSINCCSFDMSTIVLHVFSACLQSLQIDSFNIDIKTLKFLLAILHIYKNSVHQFTKDQCCRLLKEALEIVSTAKHVYRQEPMEQVILQLQKVFIFGPTETNLELHKCKPALALFMAGLANMEILECETNAKSLALWQLYHMLLRERHWALAHLGITTFGHFAARTSCNQLWRFVPKDAALSFDLESGIDAKEETFMFELKVFLEKEIAFLKTAPTFEHLMLVIRDGLMLKQALEKRSNMNMETQECELMEIDGENQSNKKRKLPVGFTQGMELVRTGLKVMGDSLSHWKQSCIDFAQLHGEILAESSLLEDMVNHLAGLADNG